MIDGMNYSETFPTMVVTPYEWQYQKILKETLEAEENDAGIIQSLPYAMINVDLTSDLPLLKSLKVDVEKAKRAAILDLNSDELNLESWVSWYTSEEIEGNPTGWVRESRSNDRLAWVAVKNELSCSVHFYTSDLLLNIPYQIASYAFLTIMLANEMNLSATHLSATLVSPFVFAEGFEKAKDLLQKMTRLENISYITGDLESEALLSRDKKFASYLRAINSYPTFFLKYGLENQSIFTIDESNMVVNNYEYLEEGGV